MPFGKNENAVGRQGRGHILALAASLGVMALVLPGTAQAQSMGAKQDGVGTDAVDAVTQPLSDLNLRSKDIPPTLLDAQDAPYSLEGLGDCEALRRDVARLEELLGPDADAPPEKRGLVRSGLKTGGDILGGMIPFRGLVRRVSGAREVEKRWERALYAGVARRSFLKGVMAGRGCDTIEEASVRSARDLLGLSE